MAHLPQIITNLTDNDYYKYTMGQMFVHQFHDMKVEWTYKNRDKDRKFTHAMIDEINYQIDLYAKLRYTPWELENFKRIDHIKEDYVRFLQRYTIERDEITCVYDEKTEQPEIHFRGYNVDVSYHEVPVMSIVSEVSILISCKSRSEVIVSILFETFAFIFEITVSCIWSIEVSIAI